MLINVVLIVCNITLHVITSKSLKSYYVNGIILKSNGCFTLTNVLVCVRLHWVHEHQDKTLRGSFYIEIWNCESWNLLVYDSVSQIMVRRPPVAEVINVTLMK
jgi:hypothetical protein